MNTKQIIERMANLWFTELMNEELISSFGEFKSMMYREFPELSFTYDVQSKTIILLTEI